MAPTVAYTASRGLDLTATFGVLANTLQRVLLRSLNERTQLIFIGLPQAGLRSASPVQLAAAGGAGACLWVLLSFVVAARSGVMADGEPHRLWAVHSPRRCRATEQGHELCRLRGTCIGRPV